MAKENSLPSGERRSKRGMKKCIKFSLDVFVAFIMLQTDKFCSYNNIKPDIIGAIGAKGCSVRWCYFWRACCAEVLNSALVQNTTSKLTTLETISYFLVVKLRSRHRGAFKLSLQWLIHTLAVAARSPLTLYPPRLLTTQVNVASRPCATVTFSKG